MQHQHRAAPEVDRRERGVEPREGLAARDGVGLLRLDAGPIHRGASVGHLRVAAVVPAGIAGDAEHDLEEPGPRPVAAVDELGEAPVGDDEDFLGSVFGVGIGHAEPPQVAPDEVDVRLVHRAEGAFAAVAVGPDGDRDRLERRARRRCRGYMAGTATMTQMAGQGLRHHLTFQEKASSSRPDQSGWYTAPEVSLVTLTPATPANRGRKEASELAAQVEAGPERDEREA